MSASETDNLLVERIHAGASDAWNELIARFEGRLLAFVESRVRNRAAAEDLVQETFIGFLTSLPNYDRRRPLESYLFSIAAHKLTDHLRREGRRPTLPLVPGGVSGSDWEPAGSARVASSIARSGERRRLEEDALVAALAGQVAEWRRKGAWDKLRCAELLLVRGWSNKETAGRLALSEQTVANYKFECLAKLRAAIRSQGLPEEVFPELYDRAD
ncbi:MAG: RNA polymerase sigma factor [Pirellulales bacterium]|nr:RNA polymerase sigma factor [Pirellulales bacterium]